MKTNKNNQQCQPRGAIHIEPLWTYTEASHYLKVSEAKLRQDVMKRKIPFLKLGRSVRFRSYELVEWVNRCSQKVKEEA